MWESIVARPAFEVFLSAQWRKKDQKSLFTQFLLHLGLRAFIHFVKVYFWRPLLGSTKSKVLLFSSCFCHLNVISSPGCIKLHHWTDSLALLTPNWNTETNFSLVSPDCNHTRNKSQTFRLNINLSKSFLLGPKFHVPFLCASVLMRI